MAGCFEWTMRAARAAGNVETAIQVNTLVAQQTADDLEAIYELLKTLTVMRWSLFFLIAVGRGKMLQEISAGESDRVMNWIFDIAREAPFAVKTTEAPHYRRVALNRMRGQNLAPDALHRMSVYNGLEIRDGHGIMFVSNTRDICPAGFLPASSGNLRSAQIPHLYR